MQVVLQVILKHKQTGEIYTIYADASRGVQADRGFMTSFKKPNFFDYKLFEFLNVQEETDNTYRVVSHIHECYYPAEYFAFVSVKCVSAIIED